MTEISSNQKSATCNFSFYLGCVAPNRYPMIEASTRCLAKHLGINLLDMNGASCCPAPGVFRSFDIDTWLAIAARNITIAEQLDADILTMCNGCYGTLLESNHLLKHDSKKKNKTNKVLANINREFKGSIKVRHILEILYFDFGPDYFKDRVVLPLTGIKAAVHYGCHLLKPSETRPWGISENPTFFDEIVEATGAKSIDYKDKFMCCGAGGGVRAAIKDVSMDFTREKLVNMNAAGADIIVNACPFCHLQFDLGQVEVKAMFNYESKIPVIYISQLIGLALGLNPYDLGLKFKGDKPSGTSPFISVQPFLDKVLEGME
ncbi:MAG: CoB--CoM heterodisulfide reductase subunit B [Promethearchaeota archaeon]